MRRLFVVASALLLAASLTGCGASGSNVGTTADQGHPALSDGEVSYDEYQAEFRAYSSCLEDAGYKFIVHDEENQTIQFSVPGGAVESGVDANCYDEEFAEVDATWQIAHIDTSESARILRTCLEGLGITPGESYDEMTKQLSDSGNDPSACSAYS